jgi:hypothetical protein
MQDATLPVSATTAGEEAPRAIAGVQSIMLLYVIALIISTLFERRSGTRWWQRGMIIPPDIRNGYIGFNYNTGILKHGYTTDACGDSKFVL